MAEKRTPAPPGSPGGPALARGDWVVWLAVFGVFALLQLALARQATGGPLLSRGQSNYYHFMTDALLSGQLSLKISPNPELLKLANPYNSAFNAPYRLLDLSLFHGHYYFYWSLVPIVLLFGPCFLLTGSYLSEAAASAAFGLACQGCLAYLLLAFRRAYFPRVGWWLAALAPLCAGFASFVPALATANSVYGVPVACAAFSQAFAWCCIFRALHGSRPLGWTWLAGLGVALAMGSRPIYIVWSLAWIVPLWALLRRHPREWLRLTLAAVVPPLAAIAGLLTINWLRFGQPAEFGMRYQLTVSGAPATSLTWSNFVTKLGIYGWHLPLFSKYFPFLATPMTGANGMLCVLPAAYLVLGLVRARRYPGMGATAWTIALAGWGGFVTLSAYPGASVHYMVDFLPACVLAGSVGALTLAEEAARKEARWPRFGIGLILAASIASALLLQVVTLGGWRQACGRMRPLSRVVNSPLFWFEHLTGTKPGPVLVRFKAPLHRNGAFEPLLTVGSRSEGAEIVFLEYVDDRHARVGFFHTGTTHWLSPPGDFDYGQLHELSVSLGSLLPPDSNPVFARWSEADREAAQQDVTLILDGRLVYRTALDFGIRHGESFRVGNNDLEGVSGPRFTGEVLEARVLHLSADGPRPLPVAPAGRRFGRWKLTVRFPSHAPPGRNDPIMTSGVPGAADFFYVFYPRPGAVAFGHDSWNIGGSASPAIAIEAGRPHMIEISYGGLYPEGGPMKGRLFLSLDGMPVMVGPEHTYDASPETVTPGENRIGGSTTAAAFSGQLISAQRIGD